MLGSWPLPHEIPFSLLTSKMKFFPSMVLFDFQTEARLLTALFPRWANECKDALHWGAGGSLRGAQELPQQSFLL